MTSEFITRVEREKDEPYTVIFRTDDADKYKHIEDECRKMIGHAKPTVDAVPVVHGYWRPHPLGYTSNLVKYEEWDVCSNCGIGTKRRNMTDDFFEEYSYSYCPWCGAKMKGEEK